MEKHQVLTVLVADDEPELLGAVCQLIDWESLGFRLVGRAGNGLDALQMVEALQPDFLLTDIRMPFISGTALTRQAKAVQPLLQVAFLSGYDDFEYAKAGIEDEIVAYLLKPISMAELTEELRKIHDKIEKRLASLTRPQGGAEALRAGDEFGRLQPGMRADLVLVSVEAPHLFPVYNPYSALVYGANSSDVSLVMASGETLVRGGKLTRLDMREAKARLLEQMGPFMQSAAKYADII